MKRFYIPLLYFFLFLPKGVTQEYVAAEIPLLVVPGNRAQTWKTSLSSFKNRDLVAASFVLEGGCANIRLAKAFRQTGARWEQWPHFGEETRFDRFVSELLFVQTDSLVFKIELPEAICPDSIHGRLRLFAPPAAFTASSRVVPEAYQGSCPCAIPAAVPRSVWGKPWNLNANIYIPPPAYTNVTHLIVHHSAGTNTSSNWGGVVAAIFDYHVNTNGWSDVGYNWLIDPTGMLYEGRGGGNNVRGAHMCGYNNNTMGVCLLGNFVGVSPPAPALETLKKLLAWKCCDSHINPAGNGPITSFPGVMMHISGHRDGCSPGYTECPGGLLYSKISDLRSDVALYMQQQCTVSFSASFEADAEPVIQPNPVRQEASVVWQQPAPEGFVTVYDVTGRIVYRGVFESGRTVWKIPVEGWASGMYFAEVQASGKKKTKHKIFKDI